MPSRLTMATRPGPDFLCIGAQRSGTTWLWSMLKKHPDIFVSPLKELHYFDRDPSYPSPNNLSVSDPLARLLSREPAHVRQRRKINRRIFGSLKKRRFKRALWYARLVYGRFDDKWYNSLFDDRSQRACGEVTPAYAILKDADVARIARMYPDLKIIFLMRNPVERTWSWVKYRNKRGNSRDLADARAIEELIRTRIGITMRNDYLKTIDTWEEYFPRKQFFYGFYDDIISRPADLLADLCRFLGVTVVDMGNPERVRNPSTAQGIPPEVERYLSRKYFALIDELRKRVGGAASDWHRELVDKGYAPRRGTRATGPS